VAVRKIKVEPQAPDRTSEATREKLLEAAGQVFAEVGFRAATVREICARAGANVAAVNYHFGDKMELYIEALRQSMRVAAGGVLADPSLAGRDPRDAVRAVIRMILLRMHATERASWYIRIMAHEMAQPTPALDRVVDEVIGPNYGRLRQLVGRIIGKPPDDEATRMCTHSIIGQVLHYTHGRPVIGRLWPSLELTPEMQAEIAEHIATFSLAGLDAIAKSTARGRPKLHRRAT
jgi:AcrR family transcriptional regulator